MNYFQDQFKLTGCYYYFLNNFKLFSIQEKYQKTFKNHVILLSDGHGGPNAAIPWMEMSGRSKILKFLAKKTQIL